MLEVGVPEGLPDGNPLEHIVGWTLGDSLGPPDGPPDGNSLEVSVGTVLGVLLG